MTARLAKTRRANSARSQPPKNRILTSVRLATGADAQAVQSLCRQLGYKVSARSLREHLATQDARIGPWALVAADSTGQIIGFLHAARSATIMEDAGRIEIGALVVDDAHRRRGIGRALVQAIEEIARRVGARVVRVRTNVVRTDAHAFYVDLGYRAVKVQTVFERTPDRAGAILSRNRTAR